MLSCAGRSADAGSEPRGAAVDHSGVTRLEDHKAGFPANTLTAEPTGGTGRPYMLSCITIAVAVVLASVALVDWLARRSHITEWPVAAADEDWADGPQTSLGRPLVSPISAACHVPVDRRKRRRTPAERWGARVGLN